MNKFYGVYAVVAALLINGCSSSNNPSAAAPAPGAAPTAALVGVPTLNYNPQSLQVSYGTYSESEFNLPTNDGSTVTWQVTNGTIPPGLQIQDTQSAELTLYGTPQFTGQWCFALTGTSAAGLKAGNEVCYTSLENSSRSYPKIVTDKVLPVAVLNTAFGTTIEVKDDGATAVNGQLYDSVLPDGITFSQNQDAPAPGQNYQFYLEGTPTEVGSFPISFSVSDSNGNFVYKQFRLTVVAAADTTSTGTPTAQCPEGYFFDPTLLYCVQSTEQVCGPGTYYEASIGSCVAYPSAPSGITCGPGTYFDPFLSQCEMSGGYRCPLNYTWDNYSQRCEREAFTCGFGQRYDWFYLSCVNTWSNSCPIGTHYDWYASNCVANEIGCPWGSYYDFASGSCQTNSLYCGVGFYWNRDQGARVAYNACDFGEAYGPYGCAPIVVEQPVCDGYSHWSPRAGGCVPNAFVAPPFPVLVIEAGRPIPPPPRPFSPPPTVRVVVVVNVNVDVHSHTIVNNTVIHDYQPAVAHTHALPPAARPRPVAPPPVANAPRPRPISVTPVEPPHHGGSTPPPAVQPPVHNNPPVVQHPAHNPPVVQPPHHHSNPPVVQPPVTEPPHTDPPHVDPPANDPAPPHNDPAPPANDTPHQPPHVTPPHHSEPPHGHPGPGTESSPMDASAI